jgi:hypothetical protein
MNSKDLKANSPELLTISPLLATSISAESAAFLVSCSHLAADKGKVILRDLQRLR